MAKLTCLIHTIKEVDFYRRIDIRIMYDDDVQQLLLSCRFPFHFLCIDLLIPNDLQILQLLVNVLKYIC